MRIVGAIVLLALLSTPSAIAPTVQLVAPEGQTFFGTPAEVTVEGSENRTFSVFVQDDNTIAVPEETGKITVQLTTSEIYVGYAELSPADVDVYVRPTARLSGNVFDVNDNLLQNVPLRILCTGRTGDLPRATDELGFFTVGDVGFGVCEVSVIREGKITQQRIEVNESKHYVVRLLVEEEQTSYVAWALLIVLLLGVAVIALMLQRKGKPLPKLRKSGEFTKRQEDILTTLSEREKLVVTQLFYGGKLTQSQLRHKTSLPKSSLHRTVAKLIQKNIIVDKEEAGIKKFQLTEFFTK